MRKKLTYAEPSRNYHAYENQRTPTLTDDAFVGYDYHRSKLAKDRYRRQRREEIAFALMVACSLAFGFLFYYFTFFT